MLSSQPSRAKVCLGLLANLACSLTIVFLNKWLYSYKKFPNVSLTCLHFFTTAAGLYGCKLYGLFERKHVPMKEVLWLSITFCGFVVCTNLSLQNNTVGTYQLAKVLTTPVIMIIQTQFYDKSFSAKIKLTMVPIVLGVLVNSYYDIQFNIAGCFWATSGVMVTSLYQILVGAKQKELGLSPMQLLFYQAPLSTAQLAVVIPFIEPPLKEDVGLFGTCWPSEVLLLVFASCCAAFFVNLTIYWVIGNTSPVTYNMFGHFKFVCTMVGGFLLFQAPLNSRQLCGILLTCLGIGFYTKFKLAENELLKKKTELPK